MWALHAQGIQISEFEQFCKTYQNCLIEKNRLGSIITRYVYLADIF